jgi:peptidoglycan/LPS O-acetylase OafA/YrhL
VAFPFLAWAWKRIGIRAIAYAALASLVFRIGVGLLANERDSIDSFLLSITFLGRWMQFAAGMAAALWVRHNLNSTVRISPVQWCGLAATSLLLEVTGLVAPSVTHGPIPLRDILLATGSAGLLASLCTAAQWVKSPLLRGPLPFLGQISYSFFLIHQPTSWYLMEFFRKKLSFSGAPLVLLGYTVGLLITALCSAVFYHIFEKPFLSSSTESTPTIPAPTRQPQPVA